MKSKDEKVSVWSELKSAKCLCLCRSIKRARGQPPRAVSIYVLLATLSECRRKEMVGIVKPASPLLLSSDVKMESTAFLQEGGTQHSSESAREHCEPVNYTISAQMPLGKEQPAPAINYRQHRWPDSFPSFISESGVIRSKTSASQQPVRLIFQTKSTTASADVDWSRASSPFLMYLWYLV